MTLSGSTRTCMTSPFFSKNCETCKRDYVIHTHNQQLQPIMRFINTHIPLFRFRKSHASIHPSSKSLSQISINSFELFELDPFR